MYIPQFHKNTFFVQVCVNTRYPQNFYDPKILEVEIYVFFNKAVALKLLYIFSVLF